MAKKKSAGSGKLSMLWTLLTMVLGAVILGFVALPHIKAEVSTSILGGASEATTTSGYSLISFEEGADVGMAVVLLLLVIFASLLIVSAILKLLCDLKVIKNITFLKVAKLLMLVCAAAVAVLAIVNIITVSTYCSSVGGDLIKVGTYAVWATLIVNAIIGVGSLITSALAVRK